MQPETPQDAQDAEPFVVIDEMAGEALPPDTPQASAPNSLLNPTEDTPLRIHLLRAVFQYGRGRLNAGEAGEALAKCRLDVPDLIAAFQIAYLPANYRDALPKALRRHLKGHRWGNALLFPAFDERGGVVDLMSLRVHDRAHAVTSVWPEPRGLLSPVLATSHSHLTVTDNLPWLATLYRQGYRDALLLRGAPDAQHQAARLRQSGVLRITLRTRQETAAFARHLRAAGIEVTEDRRLVMEETATPSFGATIDAPAQPAQNSPAVVADTTQVSPATAPSLAITAVDHRTNRILAQVGPIKFAVEMRDDGDSTRSVTIHFGGRSAEERFDLAVPRQCERFAGNAGKRVGQPSHEIVAHLPTLWLLVQERESAPEQTATVAITPEDRATGIGLLDSPDLIEQVIGDLTVLGWIGEPSAKATLFLAAMSRLLHKPVWATFTGTSGVAPWQAIGCVAALIPPEHATVFSSLTSAKLRNADRDLLRHRVMILDQAENIRPETASALRIFNERGGVGWSQFAPNIPGLPPGEVRGPISVLAAATGDLHERMRDRFLVVHADESSEQTAMVFAEQRRRLAGGAAPNVRPILARHHAAQRLLERLPVKIAFAHRIVFPTSRLRYRDEHGWLLSLVATSALLHQRQRPHENGEVLATEEDFNLVVRYAGAFLGADSDGFSQHARKLLMALFHSKLTEFSMSDLARLLPGWTRYAFRSALQDLADFGHIEAPKGGRGRLQTFRMIARPEGAMPLPSAIRLRQEGAPAVYGVEPGESPRVGELADVGDWGVANFAPRRTGT